MSTLVLLFLFTVFILQTRAQNSSYTYAYSSSTSITNSSSSTSITNSSSSSSSYSGSSSSRSSRQYVSYSALVRASHDHDHLNKAEKTALLTFIKNIHHPTTLNWNESEPGCSWTGVTCDPNGITVLYLALPQMSLTGTIPPNSIGLLSSLRVLSLKYNNLSGAIPSDFSRLTSLTTLRLNNNSFSGQIPAGFSSLSYLTTLYLNNNNFSGPFPDIKADNLMYFDVSYNKLVGRIPRSLSDFQESAFSNNTYLCAKPLPPCNASYPPTDSDVELDDTRTGTKRKIFGVYSVSAMLSLILLCPVVKNVYKQIKPPSKASDQLMEKKKLVTLFDDSGFGLEDMWKTSAEVLGEGSVGKTYKQVLDTQTVVVKKLKDVAVTEEVFATSMEGLGKMKNKYVVRLKGFYNYSSDEKWVVYDYMPAGSLYARLHGSVQTKLTWNQRTRIAVSAAKGLAYLHLDEKKVHGNIRSSNIFLQQETNDEVSLSDYGLNTLFHGSSSLNHRVTGYWAPEVFKTRKFTFESDVYSFGVLLLELLTAKTPNKASFDNEGVHFSIWVRSIVSEEPKAELFDVELTRDHNIDKMMDLLEIAKKCVAIEPNQRPLMHIVVSDMVDMFVEKISGLPPKGIQR